MTRFTKTTSIPSKLCAISGIKFLNIYSHSIFTIEIFFLLFKEILIQKLRSDLHTRLCTVLVMIFQ